MPFAPRALAAGIALLLLGYRALAAGTNSEVNGFYFVSTNGTGTELRIDRGKTNRSTNPPIHTEGWQTIRLGDKTDLTIVGASVYSLNNENSLFVLEVAARTSGSGDDFKSRLSPPQVVLRLGERGHRSLSWGITGNVVNGTFLLHDREEARVAALGLSTECVLRVKPKYNLSARFIPLKSEYSTNEPVLVRFELKNTGETSVPFAAVAPPPFLFRAASSGKPVKELANSQDKDGDTLSYVEVLEPGKIYAGVVDLKERFALDQVGLYAVNGIFFADLHRSRSGGPGKDVLWEERASADFTVAITALPGPRMTEDQVLEAGSAELKGSNLKGLFHALHRNGIWELWDGAFGLASNRQGPFVSVRDLDGEVKVLRGYWGPVVW